MRGQMEPSRASRSMLVDVDVRIWIPHMHGHVHMHDSKLTTLQIPT